MNVGSLFSGIVGIELGFEREGFKTSWFVENDQYARAILKKRFPEATVYGDIKELDFNNVPNVDVLTGGFPCQDISNAGKRAGIEGSRSSLWAYYCEAIRILRPKFALIENVSALLSRGLGVVLADLAEIGYDAEWYCVSASAVGAPHRRDRIFIIAYSQSDGAGKDESGLRGVFDGYSKRLQKNDVAYSNGSGLQEARAEQQTTRTTRESQNGWWSTEPSVGRVAHGVSNRVDRIKCLGNAVVPAVAQVFAKTIKGVCKE